MIPKQQIRIITLFQLKELQEQLVETQLQLDRVTRDKVALLTDVENMKGHLSSYTADYGQVYPHEHMTQTLQQFCPLILTVLPTALVQRRLLFTVVKHEKTQGRTHDAGENMFLGSCFRQQTVTN